MTVDDFRARRMAVLWAKISHPEGNKLTSAEMLDFLIGTVESIFPHIEPFEADELRDELAQLQIEDAARVAASEVVHQRTIRICEKVRVLTERV